MLNMNMRDVISSWDVYFVPIDYLKNGNTRYQYLFYICTKMLRKYFVQQSTQYVLRQKLFPAVLPAGGGRVF